MSLAVRRAVLADTEALAAFNTAMALETENKVLQPDVIHAGIQTLLQHPELGFYLVATDNSDNPVASLMITSEWSDWRNGLFWWIQSVYVVPDYRRQGVYRRMYQAVKQLAAKQSNVCGFRLYVEQDNRRAQQTYQSLGMSKTVYQLYEEVT